LDLAGLAGLGTALTIGAAVVGAGASVYSAYETVQQGKAAQAEYNRQAAVDELAGKNEYAASQREAEQKRLEGQLVMSRTMAYAAASGAGAGADDPTIVKILGEEGTKTKFNSDSVLYAGEGARDAYNSSAAAKRASGANNFLGSVLTATGTLAGGVGRLIAASAPFVPTRTSSPFAGATASAYAS
jgi:hypothetical protein